jgi:MoaA/NifB/PqqE/SkfB family radical SAM enzyme
MISNSEKIERIKNWFFGKEALPFKIVLIPTNRCNLNCPYCPNAVSRSKGMFKREDELEKEEWEKCAREGIELGIKEWSIIGGGEPFLRKEVVLSIVEIVKSYETDCEIITNGTLLTKVDVKKLVEMGVDRILFSIDGPSAKIHDSLRRVKGSFRRASENIKTFTKLKKKLKVEKPYLKINMVINKINFEKIDEMVKFVKKVGGQELAFHPMRTYCDSSVLDSLVLTGDENKAFRENMEKTKILAKKNKIFLNTDMVEIGENKSKEIKNTHSSDFLEKIEKCHCFEPFYTMLIDPSGFVAGCSPSGKGIKSLNIKEKTLREIWLSKELSEIREKILNGCKFDYCLKCGLTDMRMRIKNDLLESVRNEKI